MWFDSHSHSFCDGIFFPRSAVFTMAGEKHRWTSSVVVQGRWPREDSFVWNRSGALHWARAVRSGFWKQFPLRKDNKQSPEALDEKRLSAYQGRGVLLVADAGFSPNMARALFPLISRSMATLKGELSMFGWSLSLKSVWYIKRVTLQYGTQSQIWVC